MNRRFLIPGLQVQVLPRLPILSFQKVNSANAGFSKFQKKSLADATTERGTWQPGCALSVDASAELRAARGNPEINPTVAGDRGQSQSGASAIIYSLANGERSA
jgi:hypothetical protein